jgi:hypothetical protein
MLTYFSRHTATLDIDDDTRRALWESQKIAIHYPKLKTGQLGDQDLDSLDPNDYEKSGRKAMNALRSLAQSGGYVCAQYFGFELSLVGQVKPNSPIELMNGKWGNRNGVAGRVAVLKTLQLNRVKLIKPDDCAAILVGRPRQGTLMRWPNAGEAIANIVEGIRCEARLSDLSPAQQEVLCSEFLRLPEARQVGLPTLAHLLLPVGGTMKDIDIYGLATDGKRIFAQVTYKELDHASWKIDRLKNYLACGDSHVILFCKVDTITFSDGILVVPIDSVASWFRASLHGERWFSMVLHGGASNLEGADERS